MNAAKTSRDPHENRRSTAIALFPQLLPDQVRPLQLNQHERGEPEPQRVSTCAVPTFVGKTITHDATSNDLQSHTVSPYVPEGDGIDSNSVENVRNREVEQDLLFLQQRDSIASLIVEHEESLGINKSGIGSRLYFNGDAFYDCMEEESEEEEGMAMGASEDKMAKIVDIGFPLYDSEEEELEEKERNQANSIAARAPTAEVEHDPEALTAVSASMNAEQILPSLEDDVLSAMTRHDRPEVKKEDAFSRNTVASDSTDEPNTRKPFTSSRSFRTHQERRPSIAFTDAYSQDFLEKLESAKMKVEKTEAFFFNNGMSVALGGLFFAMNIVVGAHAAYQFTERGGFTTDNDILRITLPIARVGGRLVTFNCAWLLITACKYMWTMIRTHVVPILPMGFPIDDIMPKYHRFIALWIIFFGCIIHGLPQIANYASGAIAIDNGSKIWTFGKGMATKQLFITGVMLMLIFSMFFLTTIKAFRKTTAGFRWFWWFHMGGIALAYPLLIVHGTLRGQPIFLLCALAPLALYIFDVTMRGSKITNTKILEWKTHRNAGQKLVELVVECPRNFVYTPGQYAEIKFTPISSSEWHPFTIASAPNNDTRIYKGKRVKVLIFFIQASGRWTEAMYNFASNFDLSRSSRGMEIFIRGPHGSPASNFFEYKHIIVIGSGVGVTPLLSVWQYMVGQGRTNERNDDILMGSISKFMSRLSSNSLDRLDRSDTTEISTFDTFPIEVVQKPSRFRLACSKMEEVLESLSVSICLYGFFLSAETIIVVTLIFGHYTEVATFEILFSSLSLIFHIGTIIVSSCAVDGGFQYYRLFKCWVEATITLVDGLNMWLSIAFLRECQDGTQENVPSSTRLIVGLGAASVFLHAVRIFHVFYTTLKPKTKIQEKEQRSKKVSSIKGIFVNPQYSGMQFCLDHLLQPVEEGMSTNFRLQFYGTRETTDDITSSSLSALPGSADASCHISSSMASPSQCYSFHKGRPDWELVFQKAIHNAQRTNPSGDEISIGVFFCGSPAIAKCLRSNVDKVNAQYQFAARKSSTKHCKCKIVLHVENF